MRTLRMIVPALLVLALLGGTALPAAAQADQPAAFEDMEGLEKAYARTFTADLAAMTAFATPGAHPTGWVALLAMVLEFDAEAHAAAGVETLVDEIERSGFAGEGGEMEAITLDLDLDHVVRRAEQTTDGLATTAVLAVAHDGTYVHAVIGITLGDDPAPEVTSTLAALGDAEPGDAPEIFREEGTSEGGLWALFPSLEAVQESVPALVVVEDDIAFPVASRAVGTVERVTYPVVEGTPAG